MEMRWFRVAVTCKVKWNDSELSEFHSFCRINDASISYCRGVNAIRLYTILKRVERTKIILHNVKLCLYTVSM
jgi:hypothetical protein